VRGVLTGMGPFISKDRVIPLDVSRVRGDQLRIRIQPMAGFWALNRARRYDSPGAVLLIDLDNFKAVNDTFGHKSGDDVLKGFAGLLRQRMRRTDFLARVGGDEFAVLLPEADAERAQIVADELVKALSRQTAVLADQSIRITASVGVSVFGGLTDAQVLAYADLAMYEAKEAGRNCFAMYRPGKGRRPLVSARLAEAERIRHVLEEDRLILSCQPILDLHNNKVCQYELLVRLPDDEGGEPLLPSNFLYVAERFGLIQAIDSWQRSDRSVEEDLAEAHRNNECGQGVGSDKE